MYQRLRNYLRYRVREWYKRLPHDRQTYLECQGRFKLVLRKLCSPLFQVPVTLGSPDGTRLSISCDPVDEIIVSDLLERDSLYFPEFPSRLPPHPVVLDVGAHHGYYAVWALGRYPGSRIICVEPSKAALSHITANLRANRWEPRARIVHAGLANEAGIGHLNASDSGSWGNSLFSDGESSGETETVPLLSLPEILQNDQPHIVKCNAEGGEFALVDQLRTLPIRPLLLVVMVHPEFGDLDRLIGHVEEMGYRVSRTGTESRPAIHAWWNALPPAPEELPARQSALKVPAISGAGAGRS